MGIWQATADPPRGLKPRLQIAGLACQIYAFLPTGTLDARGQTGRIWLLRPVRVTR
jgi:hypothetical protein